MRHTGIIGLLLIGALASCSTGKKGPDRPPNVLFIAIDDLNDWTGFMDGHPQVQTPYLDALAERGMVFEHAYSASSECNPSRSALLSGYHPKTTGFANNFIPRDIRHWMPRNHSSHPIPGYHEDSIPEMAVVNTLPQWFREHGYYTLGCGKIFHNPYDSVNFDFEKSWDEYGMVRGVGLTRYGQNRSGITDGIVQWLDWGVVDVEAGETDDFLRAEWTKKKLNNLDPDKPFFLAVGFQKPHDPFYAPQQFFDIYPPAEEILLPPIYDNGPGDNDHNDLPEMGRIMADKKEGRTSEYEIIKGENEFGKDYRKEVVRSYLAVISYVDSCVGVVMDALDNSPHANNTIVLLWADHGWHLGEKLHYHKFTHWEEAIQTVMVVDAPGYEAGRCGRIVNAVDIYPTLVELCGLPGGYLQQDFDQQGESFVPLLSDPDREWAKPSLTTNFKRFPPMTRRGESYSHEFLSHGLRTEEWKFIEYIGKDHREYELYNLLKDPDEWDNLAGKHEYRSILEKLKTLLHRYPGGEDGMQQAETAPVVIISSPLPGKRPGNQSPVEITASCYDIDDPDDIREVEFFLDGVSAGKDESYPYTCNINNPEAGMEVRAVVTDRSGLKDEHRIILK